MGLLRLGGVDAGFLPKCAGCLHSFRLAGQKEMTDWGMSRTVVSAASRLERLLLAGLGSRAQDLEMCPNSLCHSLLRSLYFNSKVGSERFLEALSAALSTTSGRAAGAKADMLAGAR